MKQKQSSLMDRRRLNLNTLQNNIKSLSVYEQKILPLDQNKEQKIICSGFELKIHQKISNSSTKEDEQAGEKGRGNSNANQYFRSSDDDGDQQKFEETYKYIEKLGEGAHGVVKKCQSSINSKFYAVKTLEMEDEHFLFLKTNFMDIKRLTHKSIIKYKAIYINPKQRVCNIVMEFCPQPHLRHGMTEAQLQRAFFQLFDALSYLHSNYICHRDIKPDNILFDEQTGDIKLIDFGVSKNLKRRGQYEQMLTNTGTYYYKAPEMFKGAGYTEAVDCWAAGISLYEMITGVTPFASVYHSETIKNICEQPLDLELPEFQKFSPLVKDLISRLLRRDPKERLSCKQAKQHLWFASNQINLGMDKGLITQQTSKGHSSSTIKRKNTFSKQLINLANEDHNESKGGFLKRGTTYNRSIKGKEDCNKTNKKVMKTWLAIINEDVRSIKSEKVEIDFEQSDDQCKSPDSLPTGSNVESAIYLKIGKEVARLRHKSICN